MAEIKFAYSEYRPCIVCGKKALFHRWVDKAHVVSESALRGGHPAGQLWVVVGIVEYEDGTVHEAYPDEIRFVPGKIRDYSFGELEDDDNG